MAKTETKASRVEEEAAEPLRLDELPPELLNKLVLVLAADE